MQPFKQIQSSQEALQLSEKQLYSEYAYAYKCIAQNISPQANRMRVALIMNILLIRKRAAQQRGEK